jgi:hypothetical protein
MRPSPESLKAREQFLTTDLARERSGSPATAIDYFTGTDNYPKAFRVGSCTSEADGRATLQVLLLWRDDTKSAQKEVHVDTLKADDRWLISKVSN